MHRTTWFEWQLGYSQYHSRLNPLITDDECTRLVSLGACSYIVGEIGFEDSFGLAKRVEQRDGHSHDMLCACLYTLAGYRKALVALAHKNCSSPFVGAQFWHCRQFSVRKSVHWLESSDHRKLPNEWVWPRS